MQIRTIAAARRAQYEYSYYTRIRDVVIPTQFIIINMKNMKKAQIIIIHELRHKINLLYV